MPPPPFLSLEITPRLSDAGVYTVSEVFYRFGRYPDTARTTCLQPISRRFQTLDGGSSSCIHAPSSEESAQVGQG